MVLLKEKPSFLRPLFSFFGAKWFASAHYPKPEFDTLVEPFAGSACYSLRHYSRKVILTEADPKVYGVWDFLLRASPREVLRLPIVDSTEGLDIPQEAKWFIGFWLHRGKSRPGTRRSAWARSDPGNSCYWSPEARWRVATSLHLIRHWEVRLGSYHDIPQTLKATWFVDPPYQKAGREYTYNDIDYSHLSRWCRGLRGQAIVCEQEGADWLPFSPFREVKSCNGLKRRGKSREVLFYRNNSCCESPMEYRS
jgi:16S rRNA G966 N2-methylase RsmD